MVTKCLSNNQKNKIKPSISDLKTQKLSTAYDSNDGIAKENGFANKTITYLQQLARQNFTGSLLIQKKHHPISCKLYFRLGRLIWVTRESSYFPEQFQQYINWFLADLSDRQKIIFSARNPEHYYQSLAQLYYRVNATEKLKITNLIKSILVDTVFDLIQSEANSTLFYKINLDDKLKSLISLINTDLICQQAIIQSRRWLRAGLSSYSPNLFPVLTDLPLVQKTLNPAIYLQLISLIDGTKNLRFLARQTNLNLVFLTNSLLPVIQIGGISLQSCPVLTPSPSRSQSPSNPFLFAASIKPQTVSQNRSLVCCVDDSSLVIRKLDKIVSQTSYQFIGIQKPLTAIPSIIKNSPDLIFLDLMMPTISSSN